MLGSPAPDVKYDPKLNFLAAFVPTRFLIFFETPPLEAFVSHFTVVSDIHRAVDNFIPIEIHDNIRSGWRQGKLSLDFLLSRDRNRSDFLVTNRASIVACPSLMRTSLHLLCVNPATFYGIQSDE
jgi:hypothetical protein